MSKKCINCGMELPEAASFCPGCATSQKEKRTVKPPRLWRRKAVIACAVLAVLAFCFGLYRGYTAPQTYLGIAELTYTDQDGTYDLVLSFEKPEDDGGRVSPLPNRTVVARAGETWGVFSYLYAYPEDGDTAVYEEFMDKVESCTFTAIPAEGSAKPDTTLPEHMENRAFATQAANAYFTIETHEAELVWTLEMKNGDTIVLKQELFTVEEESLLVEGGAQVAYEDYQIGVGFSRTRDVCEEKQVALASGENAAVPAVVYVWKEGSDEDVTAEFLELVQECNVRTEPLDGSKQMQFNRPRQEEGFEAAFMADIMFESGSGTNEVVWTLDMQNGDQIILRHMVTVEAVTE